MRAPDAKLPTVLAPIDPTPTPWNYDRAAEDRHGTIDLKVAALRISDRQCIRLKICPRQDHLAIRMPDVDDPAWRDRTGKFDVEAYRFRDDLVGQASSGERIEKDLDVVEFDIGRRRCAAVSRPLGAKHDGLLQPAHVGRR